MKPRKTVVAVMALCALAAMTGRTLAHHGESVVHDAPADPKLSEQRRELRPEALSGEMSERERVQKKATVVWPAPSATPTMGTETIPPESTVAETAAPPRAPAGVVRPVRMDEQSDTRDATSLNTAQRRDGCASDLPIERPPIPWEWTTTDDNTKEADTRESVSRQSSESAEHWCVEAGKTLYETLTRWGARRTLHIEREGDDVPEWPLRFAALFEGSFIEAVEWLVGGIQQSFVERPLVRIHTNNVLVLSSKSERDRIR